MILRHRALIVPCLGVATVVAPAVAQDQEPAFDDLSVYPVVESTVESGGVRFVVSGGVGYQFDADVDGGGKFSAILAEFGLGATMPLTEKLDLKLGFGYSLDSYEFNDDTAFPGGDAPWDDVHTLSASPQLTLELDPKWSIFGGPIFQSTREQGADFGDSWTYGGLAGAVYRVDESLTIGLGMGGVTQIEDSARYFPVVIVNWEFVEDIRLSTITLGGLSRWSGAEVIWKLNKDWEIAGGVKYSFLRFRLDDDTVAPNGVGENTSIPIWFRASMNSGADFRLNLYLGVAVGGTLKLENSKGRRINEEDYDPAFVVGLGATFRF